MNKVSVHPTTAAKVKNDVCPKCGGELDTGWECNSCGYDAAWAVEAPHHEGQIMNDGPSTSPNEA